ncbi:hypothetical protein FB451DRAFT_1572408 [Mycena latifolia]|nr:hypothetical protein FB451DRAFT_1572408 [Mycena latifolia]
MCDSLSFHHHDWARQSGLHPRCSHSGSRNIDPTKVHCNSWTLPWYHWANLVLRLVSSLIAILALDTFRKPLPGQNQPRALFGDLGGLLYGAVSDPGVLYVHLSTRMLVDMRDGKRGQEETQRRAYLHHFAHDTDSGAWPLLLLLSEHQDPLFRFSDIVHYLYCTGHRLPACALAEGGITLPTTTPYTPTLLALALALARAPELVARRRKALHIPHYRCAAAFRL